MGAKRAQICLKVELDVPMWKGQGGQVTKADRGRLGADPALAKRFNQPIQSISTLDHCRAGRLGVKSIGGGGSHRLPGLGSSSNLVKGRGYTGILAPIR